MRGLVLGRRIDWRSGTECGGEGRVAYTTGVLFKPKMIRHTILNFPRLFFKDP